MSTAQMSDQPFLSGNTQQAMGGSAQHAQIMPVQTTPLTAAESKPGNLPAQSSIQQQDPPLQRVGNQALGQSDAEGFSAGKGDDDSGFRRNRPNTPEATETGANVASRDQQGTAHLTGNPNNGMKGSWLTQLIARMWPYITEAGERQAKAMLPDMLAQNKPTWMTQLKLQEFELGRVPPTIEDVRVFPGTDPGAEDIFLEFDFHWKGDQNISLLLNPTPKFMQSVPGLSSLVNKIFTWTVSVSDISLKGRLRTTLIPMLFDLPVVGAVQVAFVDPPQLDFDLKMPSDSHGSGLLDYVEGWADAFISDNILSKYVLPDHFFSQIDSKAEDILTPEGVMEVWLLEAQHVPKMDFFGSGQPYGKLWLRPRSLNKSTVKSGSNPRWGGEEAHFAMPVHTRVHQVITVALLDSDAEGDDEIGRAHFNLGNLTPGQTADLWLDIGVPKKSGSQSKGRERKRDKVLGFFTGAKGNQEKDVEDCRVHIQLLFHPLQEATVKAINQHQMQGQTPDPNLIEDPDMRRLVNKFNLMEEMFGNKAKGQVEANKQGKGSSNEAAAAVESGNQSGGRQAQVSSSPVAPDTASSAAGQQTPPYGQDNVPGQGSSQAEGSYMQPQALGGGNYMQ
ncbi:hypothetical protein ABBQ38_007410 [Trebouxia sp. C0009 RCD-2024]